MTDLTPRPQPATDSRPKRRSRRILPMLVLGGVVVAGGVIVTQFLTSAVDYYCNVDEVGVRSGCDDDRRLRIQGTVDEGSIDVSRGVTSFSVSFNGATMPVRYDGEPGGIFKECIPVVVHGRVDGGVFVGDRVEVKHSNEYVAVNSDRIDETDYEGCTPGAA
jgi:cytochrome c-type biogenesis protein CcmE